MILENHLDLELILEDPDSGFFVQRGIRIGTARRFLRDKRMGHCEAIKRIT